MRNLLRRLLDAISGFLNDPLAAEYLALSQFYGEPLYLGAGYPWITYYSLYGDHTATTDSPTDKPVSEE